MRPAHPRLWRRLALPGLAIALGLLLTAELMTPPGGAGPSVLALLPIGQTTAEVSGPLADRWAATVLSRPIFSADRRPERLSGDHTTGLARLAGIIIAGGSRSAIFAPDGQKPQIMSEGGEIGGYRLLHISYDSVELAGAAGTLVVHLRTPPTAPAAAPPPPTPAPSRTSLYSYDNE